MDALRNNDFLNKRRYPVYNAVLFVQRVPGDDFILLSEVKAHLRIDFADEDAYITILIKAARAAIENYTGLSLVPSEITAILRNDNGGMELPYGPITNTVTYEDDKETELTDVEFEGLDFLTVTGRYSYIKAIYEAGYTSDTLPADLRLAIYHQVAYLYENRGDGRLSDTAKQLANPYKRIGWLI